MINQEPLNFYVIIKQGMTWYNLETEIETVWADVKYIYIYIYVYYCILDK